MNAVTKPKKDKVNSLSVITAITEELESKKAQYKYPNLQKNLDEQIDAFNANLSEVEELSTKLANLKDSLENQLSVDAMDKIEVEIRQVEKELLVSKNIAKQQYYDSLEPLHGECKELKDDESTEDISSVGKANDEIVQALLKDFEPIYHTIISVAGSLESAHHLIKDSFLDYPYKESKHGHPLPGNIRDLDLKPVKDIKAPEHTHFEEIPVPKTGWINEIKFNPLIVEDDDKRHLYIHADETGYRLKIGTFHKHGQYQKWVGGVKLESKAKEYARENGTPEAIPWPSIFDGINI